MEALFPDFLRGIVSAVMNVLLMLSLMQPKYSRRVTFIGGAAIVLLDFSVSCFCYFSYNLTLLTYLDVVLFTLLCFAAKPLFKDNFMQWLYSYMTVQNANVLAVVLSYDISRFSPPRHTQTRRFVLLYSSALLSCSAIGSARFTGRR